MAEIATARLVGLLHRRVFAEILLIKILLKRRLGVSRAAQQRHAANQGHDEGETCKHDSQHTKPPTKRPKGEKRTRGMLTPRADFGRRWDAGHEYPSFI